MMDHLKIIKSRDPSLFKQIKNGKMTPRAAYKSVKNLQEKTSYLVLLLLFWCYS